MITPSWIFEIPPIVSVWTGVVLLAIVYILGGMFFHQPTLPNINQR